MADIFGRSRLKQYPQGPVMGKPAAVAALKQEEATTVAPEELLKLKAGMRGDTEIA